MMSVTWMAKEEEGKREGSKEERAHCFVRLFDKWPLVLIAGESKERRRQDMKEEEEEKKRGGSVGRKDD